MEARIYFRRCHHCNSVNWSEGEIVSKCEHCGKKFAPFFFFDEAKAMGLYSHPEETLREAEDSSNMKYPPLWGLSVIW